MSWPIPPPLLKKRPLGPSALPHTHTSALPQLTVVDGHLDLVGVLVGDEDRVHVLRRVPVGVSQLSGDVTPAGELAGHQLQVAAQKLGQLGHTRLQLDLGGNGQNLNKSTAASIHGDGTDGHDGESVMWCVRLLCV